MANEIETTFEVSPQQVSHEERGAAAVVTSSGMTGCHVHYEHNPHSHDCSVARGRSHGIFKSYLHGALQKLQCSLGHTQESVRRQEKCMEEVEMKVLNVEQQTVGLSEGAKSVLGQMDGHSNQIDSLENSVSGIRDQINSLETSISENRGWISSMEVSIRSLEAKVTDQSRKPQCMGSIKTKLEGLSTSMDSTHERLLCSLDSLECRVSNLESSVTTMTERVQAVLP